MRARYFHYVAILTLALGVGFGCTAGEAGNLVSNPGMESPSVAPESFHTFSSGEAFGGWTVSRNSIDLCGPDCWQTAEGAQSLDLGGSPGPGTIYQDLSCAPGQSYLLRFAMAGNPCRAGIKEMKVYWAGGLVADLTFDTTPYTGGNMGWVYHSYVVTAATDVVRLEFEDINHTDGYYGAALDDVSVSPVPEPSGMLALMGGLGSLGVLWRRRK